MEPVQHQMMGYDRAITMFSPDGRLLQVEYAKRTVRLGNTAIGIIYKGGVLLVTDRRIIDKLVVPDTIEKIFKIDDHMMATAAGILSDARVLFERAQLKSQQHRIDYDSSMDTLAVVKDICNLKQLCTQSGGLRPFGVSTLVAGVDEKGPTLFETDPTGLYYQYKASAIGEGETEGKEILNKEYNENLSLDDALKLSVKILKKVLSENFTMERIDAAYITTDSPTMKKITKEHLNKIVK